MSNNLPENHDQVPDLLVTPDGLEPDAAPPIDNTPADASADQPIEAPSSEAPGTPDATKSSDAQPDTPVSDSSASGTPEASAPPSTNTAPPKTKQSRAPRPNHPDREHKLLKTDRTSIGGAKTPEGQAASSMNNAKHGMYSRGPFRLMPWESQDDYDALSDRMRNQYPPIDEVSEQMLDQLTQAFWRFNRCDHAEYLAETGDMANMEEYQRGIFGASSYRTRCERSYYLHMKNLERHFADFKREQDEIRERQQDEELEHLEREAEPKPRFNEDGEEMDPNYPQIAIQKISCLPESQCNEVLEFDRTLAGKHTVKRTPLRDWEGGWMLHPSIKPKGMKGEWPDYAMGRYKDYYLSRKAEDIKNLSEDIKNL